MKKLLDKTPSDNFLNVMNVCRSESRADHFHGVNLMGALKKEPADSITEASDDEASRRGPRLLVDSDSEET